MRNGGGRFLLFAGMALSFFAVHATVDEPTVPTFVGTAYHDGGWFTCGTDAVKGKEDYLQFKELGDFLLSPRYAAPIRRIVLKLQCSVLNPTRKLVLLPFVDGVEAGALARTNSAVSEAGAFEVVSFDFDSGLGVDAFRLLQGGSGSSGTWGVNAVYVFWGAKTDDEDEILYQFAQQLPTPENLRIDRFDSALLALRADPVEHASGYQFEFTRLTGTPRTERIERFLDAPAFSAGSGWTLDPASTAKFDVYTSSGNTDGDARSLKIDKNGPAIVLSPACAERITDYSFMYKAGTGNKSNALTIYGRAAGQDEWVTIVESLALGTDTSKHQVSETLDAGTSFVQLKFVFEPGADPAYLAIDTLRVAYGGNEARTSVQLTDGGRTADPEIEIDLKGLESGRYGYRIMAEDGTLAYRNSSWSEETVVDLAWANITVSEPTDVTCTSAGDKLAVSWTAVENADHYLVTVAPVDDPSNPVVLEAKTTVCALSVPVPALGLYLVEVTAVSPGGVSRATATVEDFEMSLGKPGGLTVEAVAVDTIKAKWDEVPLAEGYQAKLFRITGNAGSAVSDYSRIADGIWPEGWTHYSYDKETYSGPVPKMKYLSSWIATCAYPAPVTSFACKFKSHVTATAFADDVSQTFIRVDFSTDELGNDWSELARYPVSTAMQTFTETIPVDRNVRRLRFSVDYAGDNPEYTQLNIEFGKLTVTYGTYVRAEIASTGTKESEAVFRDLDPTGRYVVKVVPQPSGDDANAAVSPVVDLAAEHFRKTGAISMAGLKHGLYTEDFSLLAEDARDADLAKIHLDHWQFFKGTGEAEKLLYTKTSKSTGGVYGFGDPADPDSFCIGTLATTTIGASMGVAFVNDTGMSVGAPTLTFDSIQRTFKVNPATYVLEWRVTDGATSIGTEGEWTPIKIPDTAPFTAETQEERAEYRETGITVTPELGGRLQPGHVLIFRWRHENLASGPMMAIDNVRVEFPSENGFSVSIR